MKALPYTPGELKKKLSYLQDSGKIRNYTLDFLGCHTALRVSDLLSLRIGDIAIPVKGGFRIREQVRLKEKKTRKNRTIYLTNPELKYRLNKYLKSLSQPLDFEAPLFPSQIPDKDGKVRAISRKRAWQMAKSDCIAAGIDTFGKSPHSMRKTFVNSCLEQDFPLIWVQEYLGHSTQEMTLRYAGIIDDNIKCMCTNVKIGTEKRGKNKK